MMTRTLTTGAMTIVEIVADDVLIHDTRDALDLIGDAPSDHIILHDHNFSADFFDLSTRKLGDILLKFGNYQIKLAIVGDFEKYPSKALAAFIYETNKYGEFLFLPSVGDVARVWGAQA
jgi:hypothetical protein